MIVKEVTLKRTAEGYDQYNILSNVYRDLPEGEYTVEFRTKEVQRTPRQNRGIHALFPDLANELNGIGVPLMFGKFEASWCEKTAKVFFSSVYLGGMGTSKVSRRVLANAITALLDDINTKYGGQLAIRDPFVEKLLAEN